MKIQLGDGVQMTFKPGGDSTKFIGPDGWVRISRGGIDAQPKSLLGSKIGPNDVHLVRQPGHCQNFIDAVKTRKPAVSPLDQCRPQRHDQPVVRHRRADQAEDHLGPEDHDHRGRRRSRQADAPRTAGAVDALRDGAPASLTKPRPKHMLLPN